MPSHLHRLRTALLLLPLAACSTHQSSRGRVWEDGVPLSLPSLGSAAVVLPTADRYLGVKYVWGGESPRTGFDCSGFTQFVFAKHGVRIPRTSRAQVAAGSRVPLDLQSFRPGDLIMFAAPGKPISHVAIYAGDNRIIHSTKSGGGVRYDHLQTQRGRWFRDNMVAARRVAASQEGDLIVRDLVKDLRSRGVRVDFPFDLGDLAPLMKPPKRGG